jgi:predicted DNA-binding transcriptional regulator AlpA
MERDEKTMILLRDKEVSEILKLSTATLANLRSQGKGVPFIRLGRSVRYCLHDLEAFIAHNRIPTDETMEEKE